MTKWGCANGIISNNDPAHFKQLPGFFDLMVIDAPCSGSGLFRKSPEAAKEWSPDLVKLCSQRQQRILADAWNCLKEDGFLIYSTCSYSKEENEDILDLICRDFSCESISLSPDPAWNIVETLSDKAGAYGYRFYPDRLSGEGFFLAVVQKKQSGEPLTESYLSLREKKINNTPVSVPRKAGHQLNTWIEEGSLHYLSVGESIHGLPVELLNDFEILKSRLYLKKAGIRLGKAGENDWIPDHELALANFLRHDCPSLEVEKSDTLRFLHGEPFDVANRERGWRVVSYYGRRIGWVKLLDKRINNYYPKSCRIRQ
jgi:NOL1/NOP2/fmu family ribosome biogenesis protein